MTGHGGEPPWPRMEIYHPPVVAGGAAGHRSFSRHPKAVLARRRPLDATLNPSRIQR